MKYRIKLKSYDVTMYLDSRSDETNKKSEAAQYDFFEGALNMLIIAKTVNKIKADVTEYIIEVI